MNDDLKTPRRNRYAVSLSLVVGGLICVAGVALYLRALQAPFVLDDHGWIVGNAAVRGNFDLRAVWQRSHTRFLPVLSFALNHHIHGLQLTGYHITSVCMHVAAALVVWGLATEVLNSRRHLSSLQTVRCSRLPAAFCGLLFLVHPLQTQTVNYLVQRMALMAGLFYLAAVWFYARARRDGGTPSSSNTRATLNYVLSLLAALCAAHCKENVLSLPAAIILYELCFGERHDRRAWTWCLPYIGIVAIIPWWFFSGSAILSTDDAGLLPRVPQAATRWQYLLTQTRVLVRYLMLLVAPVRQSFDHDIPISPGLWHATTLASAGLLLVLATGGLKNCRRHPMPAFGVLWFFITLSVESSLIPLRVVMNEHRLYLATAGYCFGAAWFLCLVAARRPPNAGEPPAGAAAHTGTLGHRVGQHPVAVTALAVLVLCVYATMTYQRNGVWRSALSLWDDAARKSPRAARAVEQRGVAYFELGDHERALADLEQAIVLNPRSWWARRYRARVRMQQGEYVQALHDYSAALQVNPRDADSYVQRALLYENALNNTTKAQEDIEAALEIAPRHAEAWLHRGNLLLRKGHWEDAVHCYEQLLDKPMRAADAHLNIGIARLQQNRIEEANANFDAAIGKQRDSAWAYYYRGLISLHKGRKGQARQDAMEAARYGVPVPDIVQAWQRARTDG